MGLVKKLLACLLDRTEEAWSDPDGAVQAGASG